MAAALVWLTTALLSSGRKENVWKHADNSISPYFFNAGLLYSGSLLNAAADAYAKILTQSRIPEFDVLFGPAYKGISLAAVTTVALARDYGRDQTYCYNRKEKKDVSFEKSHLALLFIHPWPFSVLS